MSQKAREAALKQLEQAKARLARLDAAERQIERKARTRRAIVLGEAVLAALAKGESVQLEGDAAGWLSSRLTRPQDRAAWGFE